jgi:hypothetical protein
VALAGVDVLIVPADDYATRAAGEAFDPDLLLHEQAIRHKSTAVRSLH